MIKSASFPRPKPDAGSPMSLTTGDDGAANSVRGVDGARGS